RSTNRLRIVRLQPMKNRSRPHVARPAPELCSSRVGAEYYFGAPGFSVFVSVTGPPLLVAGFVSPPHPTSIEVVSRQAKNNVITFFTVRHPFEYVLPEPRCRNPRVSGSLPRGTILRTGRPSATVGRKISPAAYLSPGFLSSFLSPSFLSSGFGRPLSFLSFS